MVGRAANAQGLRRKRAALAAWLAVFVSLNGLAVVIGEPALQIAVVVVTVIGGVALALMQGREGKAETTDELRALLRLPVRDVRDRDARELGVAPESPHALSEVGRDSGEEYLARDVDSQLDSALKAAIASRSSSLIVVSGPSKAGKTRTLFEAMQRCVPHGRLVVPRSADSIDELVKPGVLPIDGDRPLVLWLDDVETFLRAGPHGMHAGVLDEFDEWNTPVVVLATAGGKGVLEAGEDASQFAIPLSELMRHAEEVQLSSDLSERERQQVDRYASNVAGKIARDGIGAYMIAAPDLERKLTSGRHDHGSEPSPHGQAVAYAAVDWQRAGITDPIPKAVLEQVYPHYLPDHVDPSAEGFQEGLDWARRPLYSTVALLDGRDEFRPYDHIVAFAEAAHNIGVNEAAWSQFLAAATEEQAFALAATAYKRGRSVPDSAWSGHAEQAIKRAMSSENPALAVISAFNLGVLLTDRGDLREAEAAYRVSDEGGYAAASVNLGSMLSSRGEFDEAEAALERGEERGDPAASYNLGNLLRKRGKLDEAEAAYRRAQGATPSASFNLGNLLRERGKLGEAETAYREAVDAGHVGALVNLGNVLRVQGDLDGAEEVLRRAKAAGASNASFNLGNLLRGRGELDEAEAAYREAEEAGDTDASYNLGSLLNERGRLPEAEAAFLRAEEGGNSDASVQLGVLAINQDDPHKAEGAFRRAADAGNAIGLFNLGVLLRQMGRVEEGEDAIRRSGMSPEASEEVEATDAGDASKPEEASPSPASESPKQAVGIGDEGGGDHQQDRGDEDQGDD